MQISASSALHRRISLVCPVDDYISSVYISHAHGNVSLGVNFRYQTEVRWDESRMLCRTTVIQATQWKDNCSLCVRMFSQVKIYTHKRSINQINAFLSDPAFHYSQLCIMDKSVNISSTFQYVHRASVTEIAIVSYECGRANELCK